MIRLAMVTPFPKTPGEIRGGVEGVAYNLCREFVAIGGIDLHVVAPCGGLRVGTEVRDGLTIHWLPESRLPGFISYWTSFRLAVHECLAKIRPDVVHFQAVAGWTLGYEKPYVLTIHGIGERNVLFSRRGCRHLRHRIIASVERRGRMRSKQVIVINPYVMHELQEQLIGRSWSIENPVSQEFFDVARGAIGKTALYIGVLSDEKNIHGLIRAFRKVVDVIPDARLRIGGPAVDTLYEAACRSLIEQLDLGGTVRILGPLDRRQLLDELELAKCLVLVSHQETAPMVVGEALAAGVPVIASKICGLPYLIDHGRTGLLVNQNDDDEIAAAICDLMTMEDGYDAMSRLCKAEASRRFQAREVATRTLEVYDSVRGAPVSAGSGT